MSSIAHRGFVHVGMDVSKDAIAVAVLSPDRDTAEVDKIFHDADSVRRLVKRLGESKEILAPSLIPKGSGDRVKTDRRDARRLAGLHRAGELTPIAIPTPAQEGVRDLCRTRGDMVQDLTRARNRLSGFLLRHSVVWRGGSKWTERHRRWLATLSFDDAAIATTYSQNRCAVSGRRGVRLASLPQGPTLHELHRPRARGELDRSHPASRLAHPRRQCPPGRPAL